MKILYLGGDWCSGIVAEVLSIEGADFDIRNTTHIEQFKQELKEFRPEVLLLDCINSSIISQSVSATLIASGVSVPFIIITGAATEDIGLAAIKDGADDYVLIENPKRLLIAIHNSLEKSRLKEEKSFLLNQNIKSKKKLLQATRIYTFISQISHAIVSIEEEHILFREACRIATEIGGFSMAWIGSLDNEQHKVNLVESQGIPDADLHLFKDVQYDEKWPQYHVLQTGTYHVCNNVEAYFDKEFWKLLARKKELGSFIVLPIRKGGDIIATFSLYSHERNFFSGAEIKLLTEAASEVSFKLDVFEKDRLKALADHKLRQSKLRLKQAQASAHLGSWELDFASGMAEWSEEALHTYGLPEEDTQQSYEAWLSFIHPDDLDYVLQKTSEARENISFCKLRHRILRGDGSIRHLVSDSQFVFDEEERPVGMSGTSLNITDIILTQEALRESESKYSTLFELSPQPGWLYDLETFRFVQVNKAAIDQYGYTEEEFLTMTIWDIRPKEEFLEVMECIRTNVWQRQSIHTRKFRHYKKSGELIDVDIYSSSVVLNDKPFRLIIAIDVTDRNSYENIMTSAIIQTQEDERNEIGAELHDNVCQVLASTLLKLSVLQQTLPEEGMKSFKQIRSNITFATKELRNLSHRLAPPSFEDSTLEELLGLLINTYNAGKKHRISLHYDSQINEHPLSYDIKLNLYRMIQEQLSNILKHSVATDISIRLSLDSDSLKLTISDSGNGCNMHDTRNSIGLANMKRRIQLFSGNLEIVSTSGEGCLIKVELPVLGSMSELLT